MAVITLEEFTDNAEKAEEALSLAANGEIVEFKFFDDVNEREASVTMEVAELNGFV